MTFPRCSGSHTPTCVTKNANLYTLASCSKGKASFGTMTEKLVADTATCLAYRYQHHCQHPEVWEENYSIDTDMQKEQSI